MRGLCDNEQTAALMGKQQGDESKNIKHDAVAALKEKADRGEPITAQDLFDTFGKVSTSEPQKLYGGLWNYATSDENKFELWNGTPFSSEVQERDRLALCLVYSMGLRHFAELLPDSSREELKRLLYEIPE